MPVNPDLVLATGAQVVEIPVSFSETTSQSAGTVIQGQMQGFGAFVSASTQVTVPITEVWHIIDTYNVGGIVGGGADGTFVLLINGYIQNVQWKVSTSNLNLLTRFRFTQSIVLAPASTFSLSLVLAGTPTNNVTQVQTLKIIRAPYTG